MGLPDGWHRQGLGWDWESHPQTGSQLFSKVGVGAERTFLGQTGERDSRNSAFLGLSFSAKSCSNYLREGAGLTLARA